MKKVCGLWVYVLLLGRIGLAAPRQHVVALGKWTTVKLMVGEDERTALDLKVRALLVDGQNKEFITGPPHGVTNRTFVVQRVFRLNDSLPQETVPARWRWERGGWLLVNGVSGKMQLVPLPEFDPYNTILRPYGFGTMSRIAGSPTTARKCRRSSCNSAGESHC